MNAIFDLKLGVIIPTYNRKDSLKKCLDCLNGQVLKRKEYSFVPIIVVDGSTDGTLEMIKCEFPRSEIVLGDGNWWYTRCINAGIRRAREMHCDFVLTLNDDLVFQPDYLNTLLDAYFSLDQPAIIGSISLTQEKPRLITFSGVQDIDSLLKENNYIPKFSRVEEEKLSGMKKSMVLSGRGILYPMGVFDELGLYDEKLVQYGSETDFTYRASKNNKPVMICFDARVYENVQLTSDGAVYNNPKAVSLFKSFVNAHSINSLKKIFYYSIKHKGPVAGSLIAMIRVGGILKNFMLVKFRTAK